MPALDHFIQMLVQGVYRRIFFELGQMRIDGKRDLDIFMPEESLRGLHVDAGIKQHGDIGVSEHMRRDIVYDIDLVNVTARG